MRYPRKQCSFPIKKEDTYHTTILQPNTTCDIQYWYWYQGLDKLEILILKKTKGTESVYFNPTTNQVPFSF